jgi:predicted ArsR family transcriptional regulator
MSETATRQSIVEYLQSHSYASTKELARELGITLSGVRYHLSMLSRDGLIEEIDQKESDKGERGRPPRFVRLSVKNRPHNLDQLARALIRLVKSQNIEAKLPIEVEIQLADLLAGQPEIIASLPRRLTFVLRSLNQQHYKSTWEARPQGPRITFHNCPYAAVWAELPTLCQMDRLILVKMLGADVEMLQTMFDENADTSTCIFQVKLPSPQHS